MPQIGCLSFCATVFDSDSLVAVLNPNCFLGSNLLSRHHHTIRQILTMDSNCIIVTALH
jgi:hypothetical protein